MKNIQIAISEYVKRNKFLYSMTRFASVLALIYPIYCLLSKISFMSPVTKVISSFSTLLLFLYYLGTLLCFSKNKLIPLDIAYICMAINYLFNLQYGITFNRLVYIAVYGFLVAVCIIATRKTSQWSGFIKTSLDKTAKATEAAGNIITPRTSKPTSEVICPKCSTRNSMDMKFCKNCGNQLHS